MEKELFNRYLEVHNNMIREHGYTVKALYGSLGSQQKRFEILAKLMLQKDNFSILDLGCGLCDFFSFLEENSYTDFNYTGADINDKFLSESLRRYPQAELISGSTNEILATGKSFDYVVASGLYNLGENAGQAADFFAEQFEELFPAINVGFAVNFLSIHSPTPNADSVYHDPLAIIKLCFEKFGSRVVFHQNYLPHDFTIFVYK